MRIVVKLFNSLDCLLDEKVVRVGDQLVPDAIRKAVCDLTVNVLEVGDTIKIVEAD